MCLFGIVCAWSNDIIPLDKVYCNKGMSSGGTRDIVRYFKRPLNLRSFGVDSNNQLVELVKDVAAAPRQSPELKQGHLLSHLSEINEPSKAPSSAMITGGLGKGPVQKTVLVVFVSVSLFILILHFVCVFCC